MAVIEISAYGERRRDLSGGVTTVPYLIGETWQMCLNGRYDDDRTIWYPTPEVLVAAVGPPTVGFHMYGTILVDSAATMWVCVTGGTPGTWVKC